MEAQSKKNECTFVLFFVLKAKVVFDDLFLIKNNFVLVYQLQLIQFQKKLLKKMATVSQLSSHVSSRRSTKKRPQNVPALAGCPQKKGIIRKLVTRTPKKPNSAIRKLALLRLTNGRCIYAYLPGEGKHSLQEHSVVLVRGGRVKDLPGIKYKRIRGVYDFEGLKGRTKGRSKYGTKRSITT